MYSLPDFKERDQQVVRDFIRRYPFAFLTGVNTAGELVATQVPFFADERDGTLYLSAHIMKNTDHHKAFMSNPNVLAVFTGPDCYVSASWYKDQKQASTWNYMSVHARGILRFQDDASLLENMRRTTNYYENDPSSGSNFEDLSSEYVNRLKHAIVVFEIEVTSIENVFKLSQNRDEESYDNIIRKLSDGDADARQIAAEMEKRRSQLFKATTT